MDWPQIRAHYERLLRDARDAGRNQTKVGRAGGVNQNQISKLIRNTKRGPTVETFVAAVQGLGISLSTFFAQLEQVEDPLPVRTEGGEPENRRHLFLSYSMADTTKQLDRFARALAAFDHVYIDALAGPGRRKRPRKKSLPQSSSPTVRSSRRG